MLPHDSRPARAGAANASVAASDAANMIETVRMSILRASAEQDRYRAARAPLAHVHPATAPRARSMIADAGRRDRAALSMIGMKGRSALAAVAALAISAWCAELRADEADPWWGRDKALHFAASGVIAAGGYAIGAAAFDARYKALLTGGAAAVAAGTGKELADLAGAGDPSWRDFTWDLIGTVAGLGLAWTLDRVVRSDVPAFGAQPNGIAVSF